MHKETNELSTYPSTTSFTYWNKSWAAPGAIAEGTYSSNSEAIDTYNGDDGRFRPCLHIRDRTDFNGLTPNVEGYPDLYYLRAEGSNCSWRFGTYYGAHICAQYGFEGPQYVAPSIPEWDALDVEAVDIMTPSAAINGLSIVNFTLELRDFRRLASRFMVHFHNINNRALTVNSTFAAPKRPAEKKDTVGKYAGRKYGKTIRSQRRRRKLLESVESSVKKELTLRQLSNRYLSYSFAWAPLVSDLLKIHETLLHLRERLAELKKRQGVPQTRHYHRYLTDDDETSVGVWSDWKFGLLEHHQLKIATFGGQINRAEYQRRTGWITPPVYRATMRYTYAMPGLDKEDAVLRGYLDAFGFKWDPSIIWNAIPFTFILDWVADVGNYLRQFSVDNLQTQLFIEDFSSSVKALETCEHRFRVRRTTPSPLLENSVIIGTEDRLTYHRRTGIPALFASVSTSALSLRQASLGAALFMAGAPTRYRVE
jgi:hypothetical protein